MSGKWLCVTVGVNYYRGDKRAAIGSIKKIFGKDLKEIRVVCNETMWNSGEYYCFVLCSNYDRHIQDLKSCVFLSVVPSYDNPNWLSLKEVNDFVCSVEKNSIPRSLFVGDIVVVKEGYLKNLYGLVLGKIGKNKYRVSFRFYLRRMIEILSINNLRLVENLFKRMKFPVTDVSLQEQGIPLGSLEPELKEALLDLACRRKICRKAHRQCAKTG